MPRLAALLTVLASFITLLVALAAAGFTHFAAVLTTATVVGLVGAAIGFRRVADDGRDRVVTPLLASVVLGLVLATTRYFSGTALFGVPIDSPTWFAAFVCAPLSLMLIAAHFLTRRTALGLLLTWWSAAYVAADALYELHLLSAGIDAWMLAGALVAIAQLGLAVRMAQLLLRPSLPIEASAPSPSSDRRRNLWTILFISVVVPYAITLFTQAGPMVMFVVVGSMMGGMIGWRRTTSRRPADPALVVPLFTLMLALFYIHVGEEMLTNFNGEISAISGTPWSYRDDMIIICLLGPIVWFAAALSLWKRQALGNFILWFLIVGMILGEPAHLVVFPTMRMLQTGGDYAYFSGMYTALFPMVPAILALVVILRDRRRNRGASDTGVSHAVA